MTQSSDSPSTFKMNRLQISGKSSIRFEDESTSRPYRTTLQIKEFQMSNINTADAGSPALIKLDTGIGDYSSVTLNGDVKPFEELLSIDMKGQIHALAMPPLSSYTGPTIGYNLTSGQMDADLNIKATSGEMDSSANIRMRNLEVAKVDPDKVPEIDNQMDVPLEQALAFLEDDNDEIGLNIEIKGNINNPEFDIQDVINQALGKAMKYAAVQYLKYTLQPFGTYIALAEVAVKAGKEIARVRLDPVQFAPGSSDLNETAEQYLKRVAEILANRPSLRMEICGKASEKDRAPSEQDLLNLAKTRAEVIKSSLVGQYKISHERMYLCLPEILEAPEQQPVAELLIE
jgi:outer membrane protein OmpA-like peptidoglycan-associated protein